jgi:hypothetical protein
MATRVHFHRTSTTTWRTRPGWTASLPWGTPRRDRPPRVQAPARRSSDLLSHGPGRPLMVSPNCALQRRGPTEPDREEVAEPLRPGREVLWTSVCCGQRRGSAGVTIGSPSRLTAPTSRSWSRLYETRAPRSPPVPDAKNRPSRTLGQLLVDAPRVARHSHRPRIATPVANGTQDTAGDRFFPPEPFGRTARGTRGFKARTSFGYQACAR